LHVQPYFHDEYRPASLPVHFLTSFATGRAMQTENETEKATKDARTPDSGGSVSRPEQGPAATEPGGLDPTRYGDWEKNGRCIDF
jgi:hypothetical protein